MVFKYLSNNNLKIIRLSVKVTLSYETALNDHLILKISNKYLINI